MPALWCVRADFGRYADDFKKGGYAGIGWLEGVELSAIRSRDELYPIYQREYPEDKSNIVIGQQVGQIARFLIEIKSGDFVITPAANTELLYYGMAEPEPSYYYFTGQDGCPFRHRRKVKWDKRTLKRGDFSVPFQNTIRSSLTVFSISQADEVFGAIGRNDLIPLQMSSNYDPYATVIKQLLSLDAKEFEILVGHLLTALGFEGSEVIGGVGDGGVDATGELNVSNLAKIKIFVQAKRYQSGAHVSKSVVRSLRQAIPVGGQGAFITTADYQPGAADIATEPGFPRIGLINGRQLVDLLVEHWSDIPEDFQIRLGLRPGLVLA